MLDFHLKFICSRMRSSKIITLGNVSYTETLPRVYKKKFHELMLKINFFLFCDLVVVGAELVA